MSPEPQDIEGWCNKYIRDGAIVAAKPNPEPHLPTVTSTLNLRGGA